MKENNIIEEEKLYPICVNYKYGFIDKTGKVVIEPKFDNAGNFSKGIAFFAIGRCLLDDLSRYVRN